MYTVLGLSDSGNVELSDHYTESQCRDFIKGYTRFGNWGGYFGLSIISPNGEYLETFTAPEE
jgi:hypothetical protein